MIIVTKHGKDDRFLRIQGGFIDVTLLLHYAKDDYPRRERLMIQWMSDEAGYEHVRPEQIGALTDAPIFVDSNFAYYTEEGELRLADNAAVYWFPDYAVRDPWQELIDIGYVDFVKGE